MRRSFYYHFLILSLIMLSVAIFIASVAMVPAYFISSIKENLANAKLDIQKNEVVPPLDQHTTDVIKDLNGKLTLVDNAEKSKFNISTRVINAILLKKIPEIKITSIVFNTSVTGSTINISGTAPSREVLLAFRRALEDDVAFKKVDLPISNFVKGSNIQFSLSLIPS